MPLWLLTSFDWCNIHSQKKINLFEKFNKDIQEKVELLSLPSSKFLQLAQFCRDYFLDFDDAYQLCITTEFGLTIKTMDKDFERVKGKFSIEFIT